MRLLIIGGTGAFSGRITERAVALGHEVVLANRGQRPLPPGLDVPVIRCDRDNLAARADEFAAFAPEAVVDSICFRPEQAQALVDLFQTQRIVVVSTVDVYGEEIGAMPVTEDRPPTPVSDYGKGKLAAEKVLLNALGERLTIFRPSHILGRGFLTTSLWSRTPFLVDRIRKNKPVPAIDGGRNLMTPVYGGDIAEWVLHALKTPGAGGQVFNAVGPEIIPQLRYYQAIAQTLETELQIVAVPSHVFRRYLSRPPQFNWHRPYSCQKAVEVLRYAPQFSPEDMIRETVEHMVAHGLDRDCDEDPFDDRLVELLLRHEKELGKLLEEKTN